MPMNQTHRSIVVAIAFLTLSVVCLESAEAQSHRARLSADLKADLAADSQDIDVIVSATPAEVRALARRHNLLVKRVMRSGAVLQVTAGQLDALQQDEAVEHLSSDLPVRSTSAIAATAIGADQVWAGSDAFEPLNGLGVGVAVIDSGIDLSHQALANRVVASIDFTGGTGADEYGHGTHIAALIAGVGGTSFETAAYRGMASNAHLIDLRVLDEFGAGVASDVIEAIDWAIENRAIYGIRAINLSLGAPVLQSYRDDPLCAAVERAVAAGMIVVAAAGNFGQTAEGQTILGGITSPANDPYVIAVGALDTRGTAERSDDTVAAFSSRGPTMYDEVLKPDLVAPGAHVVSAEAQGSYIATTYGERHVVGSGPDAYIQLSGTSMSAAVTSGAVALLIEGRPSLSPGDAKAVLQLTSSTMLEEGLVASGAGSLNVVAAAQVVQATTEISLPEVQVAGEMVSSGGVVFTTTDRKLSALGSSHQNRSERNPGIQRSRAATLAARRGSIARTLNVVWVGNHTIIWGNLADESIVWGSRLDDTIIWGSRFDDTIIWGSRFDGTIIWASRLDDTIIWGSRLDDTIIWGSHFDDTIIWGSRFDDPIIWGSHDLAD